MAPKDKKRRSSPTGSDGSGQSSSSTSSMGLEQLFATLPPSPPSERALSRAPALALDPESLRAIPERTPWTPGDGATWLYRAGNKVLTGIVSGSSSAAKWVAENDATILQSISSGGASILQGAGIAGQPAAAPAPTAGQGAYGGGVTISGLVSAYRGVKELSKLYSNYKHPEREPKKVNYTQLALDLATAGFVGVYGGYSTGAVQDPGTAQMGMAVGAIGAGLTSGAVPWFESRPQPAPTPAPSLPPASPMMTPPGGYQLETPYHASMASLTQQMQGYQLSDLTPANTRTSSVSTGISDSYGRPPAPEVYPRQPYPSGSYDGQQSYQQGTFPPPQNPVSSSVSSYSYYPTDGQNSQQSTSNPSTTRYRGNHHGSSHQQKRGGNGGGPAM